MNETWINHTTAFFYLIWGLILYKKTGFLGFTKKRLKPKNKVLKKLLKAFRVIQFKIMQLFSHFDRAVLPKLPDWAKFVSILATFFVPTFFLSSIIVLIVDDAIGLCEITECEVDGIGNQCYGTGMYEDCDYHSISIVLMLIMITLLYEDRYVKYFKKKNSK